MTTDTTRPYTAMIPDITTGMRDCAAKAQTSASHSKRGDGEYVLS